MKTEDGHIVHECINGDKSAFAILIDKYKAAVFAIAYDKLRNFHDAQDIAQEVFIKAFQKLGTLKNYDKFAVWLHSITNNLCKNYIRSQSRRPDSEFLEDQDESLIDRNSMKSFKDDIENEMINDALNSLPEIYRQVLTLHYLGGMRDSEIAEFLGMSHTNVRQKLMKARTQLKEEMISMMDRTFEEQKLQAGFTFRLVEIVKRIKIHPISPTKGLPWGLSLATGLIAVALSINPHLTQFNWTSASSFVSSNKAKVLEVGEFPVNIINTSQIPNISKGISEGKGSKQPDMQNAFFMSPQAEGVWTRKASMPNNAKVSYHCASVVDGKIYIIGTARGGGQVTFSTVYVYDPVKDTWDQKSDMPTSRGYFCAGVANGKIYAINGTSNGICEGIVEEYDPVSDKWEKKPNAPTMRNSLTACTVNEKIYAIGGLNWLGSLSTVEEYDPANDKWETKVEMPTPRDHLASCVVNGKIYAIGGFDRNQKVFSTVEEYDPVKDVWTKKADMPTARYLLSACAADGKIYAAGGLDNNGITKLVEIYDPVKDIWSKGVEMLTPRDGTVSSIDGNIYAIGGEWIAGPSFAEEYNTGFASKSIEAKGKLQNTWGKIKTK